MKYGGHGYHHHKPTKEALEFRLIGGAQNNLTKRDLYSAGAEFARVGAANFADGFLAPRDDGPLLALISNLRFSNPA
jgi:hypothetical protein